MIMTVFLIIMSIRLIVGKWWYRFFIHFITAEFQMWATVFRSKSDLKFTSHYIWTYMYVCIPILHLIWVVYQPSDSCCRPKEEQWLWQQVKTSWYQKLTFTQMRQVYVLTKRILAGGHWPPTDQKGKPRLSCRLLVTDNHKPLYEPTQFFSWLLFWLLNKPLCNSAFLVTDPWFLITDNLQIALQPNFSATKKDGYWCGN